MGGGILAHELQLLFAIRSDEGDDVGIHAEAGTGGAQGIGADHVGVLAGELFAGVFDDVVRLHGEAAEELALPLVGSEVFQNVLGALELDGELAVLFLHLGVGNAGGGVVADCSGLDDDVHIVRTAGDGLEHILGILHGDDLNEHGRLRLHVGGNQGDLRAPEHGGFGDGHAHLARGMVGDEAHGVDGFAGGSGCDQDALARQVLGEGPLLQDILQKGLRLRHLACAGVAAGEVAVGGLDDLIAEPLELGEVVLDDGVFKHLGIHGGGDDLVALAGHDRGGQHIVRQTVCDLADDIGGGRSHQHHIGPLGQSHMLHRILEIPVEGVHQTLVARQGLKGDGIDEIGGIPGHEHLHIRMKLFQHGGQICDLIGGDGAGDCQNDGLVFQHRISSLVVLRILYHRFV